MLGGIDSPMLEMRDRELRFAGLSVWLPFSGRGLTGLMTPDMSILGVGGWGDRDGGIGLPALGAKGDFDACVGEAVDGLLKSDNSALFWSTGRVSLRSKEEGACVAGTSGCRGGTACVKGGLGD